MIPELAALMTHTVTIYKRGRSFTGDFVVLETNAGVKAFVEHGRKLVTNRKGEEVASTAIVYLADDAPLDTEYEYYLIDMTAPYVRSGMEVILVESIDDPRTGVRDHLEVAVR